MKRIIIYFAYIILLVPALSGCYKYKELELEPDPAYFRVFNSVSAYPDIIQGGNISTFFTFLMDPETDEKGIPVDATVKQDFFTTRELYSASYPINSGNSSEGHYVVDASNRKIFSTTPVNFEYPGNAKVLTAPAINGFDMSAWAQVKPGKHRIVFVVRPKNSIPFTSLSKEIRNQIVIDTTVNYEKGEVYTMQILLRNMDKAEYGLYIRREKFVQQAFEENKIYVGFINLSGVRPKLADLGYQYLFPDKVSINYSYSTYQNAPTRGYQPMPGYNRNFYSTLTTRMDTTISFMTLPLLNRDAFFEKDTLRNYIRIDDPNPLKPGPTLPYADFYFSDGNYQGSGDGLYRMECLANPAVLNTYRYGPFQASSRGFNQMPLLNQVVNANGKYHIYATLNIMEIVYNKVYMMQVQRAINEVPK